VTLSSFALGVALGFSRRFAFAACLWLAVLLFPPLNFVFGLQGWLATNPSYGHTLALSNLLLVAFIEIGAERRAKTSFAHRLAVNFLLANCILLLIMLSMLAAPFYNAGMLLGSLLLAGVIFLSSTSYQQILWRLGAGIYVLACCAALHFPEFFAGARDYSARFSAFDRAWLEFHWPARLSPELLAHARHGLCEWGVLCDRFTQWPLVATGSYWLQLSIILGGVAVAIRMPSPLARIGAVFSALWTVLLVVWIGASFGVIASPALSPLYVYLMMYPLWALLSLYVLTTLLEIGAAGLAPKRLYVWRSFARARRTSSERAARNRAPRRSSKFSSGKSRSIRGKFFAVRSPLSSVQPQVRCASKSSETPNGRSSRARSKNFCSAGVPIRAALTICSICGGAISRPCRSTVKVCPSR